MTDKPETTPAGPTTVADAAATTPPLTRTRKVMFAGAAFVMLVLFVELAVRVGFFVTDNFSAYYLTFGFVPDIEHHSAEFDGYTKFQPHSTYRYKLSRDKTVSMAINGDGFRSTSEFVRPKPAGTVRIVTLGESSTFGLTNEDGDTYPSLLEERLGDRFPGRAVEVYNLGVPHYRSNNIVAVARAELAQLEPDIVTLYAGYNNAMSFRPAESMGFTYAVKDWLKYHSVAYRSIHPYVVLAVQKASKLAKRDVVGMSHLHLPVDLPPSRVEQLVADSDVEFSQDLDSLRSIVERMGAKLVLVTQTYTISRLSGFRLTGPERTYAQELAYVDSVLTTNGAVAAPYSSLLIHHRLMETVRRTASEHDLPLVEGIAALDRDRREVMASMVHLTREGNLRLAAAIDSGLVRAGLVPATPTASVH